MIFEIDEKNQHRVSCWGCIRWSVKLQLDHWFFENAVLFLVHLKADTPFSAFRIVFQRFLFWFWKPEGDLCQYMSIDVRIVGKSQKFSRGDRNKKNLLYASIVVQAECGNWCSLPLLSSWEILLLKELHAVDGKNDVILRHVLPMELVGEINSFCLKVPMQQKNKGSVYKSFEQFIWQSG